MAECVAGGALSNDGGTLRFDPSGTAPVALIDRTVAPSYYSFDHNNRPTDVDGVEFNKVYSEVELPPGRDMYLLATLDVGQSSMGVTSRNGIYLSIEAYTRLASVKQGYWGGRADPVWEFGGRYDAGTNFIWRNQGVIETHHPALTVDLPIWGAVPGQQHVLLTRISDAPDLAWAHMALRMRLTVIGWNDGVGGEAPVNFFDTPEVRMRLWGFPVVA